MRSTLNRHWLALSHGVPGRRFQDRYAAAHQSRANISWRQRGWRVFLLLVALAVVAVALSLLVLPGPASPFFFLAGTLLARESLWVARLLDWIELQLRVLVKWGGRHWAKLPRWGRFALVALMVCVSVTSTYISFRLFMG